jgi:2-polyprenyl-6-hydroxyphenyl methylase/3-demethylubiquinone-9 3-methyltransferase
MLALDTRVSFRYTTAAPSPAHGYLWPALKSEIGKRNWPEKRAFDLGCGNGCTANMLSELGFAVTGVDPSETGIAQANAAFPHLKFLVGSAYDPLAEKYGTFPLLVSLEVVEHVYAPRDFATTAFDLLQPGGMALISTPYHGYLKNLAIALAGGFDRHFTSLTDGGHIKFWSKETLSTLLREAGFADISFLRVGRVPSLAKSMIAICTKPG